MHWVANRPGFFWWTHSNETSLLLYGCVIIKTLEHSHDSLFVLWYESRCNLLVRWLGNIVSVVLPLRSSNELVNMNLLCQSCMMHFKTMKNSVKLHQRRYLQRCIFSFLPCNTSFQSGRSRIKSVQTVYAAWTRSARFHWSCYLKPLLHGYYYCKPREHVPSI